jgi:hypothetical protein
LSAFPVMAFQPSLMFASKACPKMKHLFNAHI